MENENMENMDPAPDEGRHDDEKKFSQQEVDEIVRKRLERQRKKFESEQIRQTEGEPSDREKELSLRESAIKCKEYLLQNNLPVELFDVIGVTEPEKFIEKTDQLTGLIRQNQTYPGYTVEPYDYDGPDPVRAAFGPGVRHKPKSWY